MTTPTTPPTPPTPPSSPAPPAMRNPEQLEAGITAALRDHDLFTAARLLGLLSAADRERAQMVYEAVTMGTRFRAEEGRGGSIAVDFDGPLHAYSRGWGEGTIYDATHPGALAGIWALQQLGSVFVFTSRAVDPVAAWLHARRVPVAVEHGPHGVGEVVFWEDERVLVTNRKLPARWYLDDRGVPFVDTWAAALHAIAERWHTARAEQKARRTVSRPPAGRG